MSKLWAELLRRRVVRVSIAYALAALALAEGADIFLPNLGYPELVRPAVYALVLGFPVAVVLAWLFQISPDAPAPESTAATTIPSAEPAGHERSRGHSVAVLPFTDMSADGDQGYFADGIAEELINALAKLSGLRVAARTSTFALKGREEDVREIGRKLGVSTVLEGSVRKAGDRVRVTAQLIDVADGFHLFSETYDRELADIFRIQDEITGEVVQALEVTLLSDESVDTPARTTNLDAYDLYLRGRYYWHRRYEVGLQKALEYFTEASALDPRYALPYTGIADTFTVFGLYGFIGANDARARAGTASSRALELNPGLAEAHFSHGLGRLCLYGDFEGARSAFDEALRLKPGFGEAHGWKGGSIITQGRFEEGLAVLDQALPMDPHSTYLMEVTAIGYAWAKRYARAVELCEEILTLEPDSTIALYTASFANEALGHLDQTIVQIERVVDISGRHPTWLMWLARTQQLRGELEEAAATRAEIEGGREDGRTTPGTMAALYAGLGEGDLALQWLARAIDEDGFVPGLVFPGMRLWEPVWSHAGFVERWQEMGIDITAWQ